MNKEKTNKGNLIIREIERNIPLIGRQERQKIEHHNKIEM